jgi:glycolate oxidase iron-sulfur subunit
VLGRAGVEFADCGATTGCCGSAGSYALLQPAISERLRDRSLEQLSRGDPGMIATANIGCQLHLQAGTDIPVVHWIELLDGARETN